MHWPFGSSSLFSPQPLGSLGGRNTSFPCIYPHGCNDLTARLGLYLCICISELVCGEWFLNLSCIFSMYRTPLTRVFFVLASMAMGAFDLLFYIFRWSREGTHNSLKLKGEPWLGGAFSWPSCNCLKWMFKMNSVLEIFKDLVGRSAVFHTTLMWEYIFEKKNFP